MYKSFKIIFMIDYSTNINKASCLYSWFSPVWLHTHIRSCPSNEPANVHIHLSKTYWPNRRLRRVVGPQLAVASFLFPPSFWFIRFIFNPSVQCSHCLNRFKLKNRVEHARLLSEFKTCAGYVCSAVSQCSELLIIDYEVLKRVYPHL